MDTKQKHLEGFLEFLEEVVSYDFNLECPYEKLIEERDNLNRLICIIYKNQIIADVNNIDISFIGHLEEVEKILQKISQKISEIRSDECAIAYA